MSAVINLLNLKGGCGKTVSTVNLACSLSKMGKKVLVIDTDSQGNIATAMGLQAMDIEVTLASLLSEAIDGDVSADRVQECIVQANGLDIIPANMKLAELDFKLTNALGREYVLKGIVDSIRSVYDFIIIDCPPSLGMIVINALVASDYTLIPVETHYLCFESLKVMLNTIQMVKRKLNPNLEIAGIFMTMYQSRTNLSKTIKEMVRETYGGNIKVFDEHIPYSVKAAEQTLYGKSIIELSPEHPVSAAYWNIAKELSEYGK